MVKFARDTIAPPFAHPTDDLTLYVPWGDKHIAIPKVETVKSTKRCRNVAGEGDEEEAVDSLGNRTSVAKFRTPGLTVKARLPLTMDDGENLEYSDPNRLITGADYPTIWANRIWSHQRRHVTDALVWLLSTLRPGGMSVDAVLETIHGMPDMYDRSVDISKINLNSILMVDTPVGWWIRLKPNADRITWVQPRPVARLTEEDLSGGHRLF